MLVLFIGDDWAEDHHDVEVQDATGRRLGTARLPEGVEGIAKLHALIARHGGEDLEPGQVVVGIETDRGPWVQALIAVGYRIYAVNPRQAARFKERYGTSGAKSDKGDAHALADMVRIDGDQLRPVAGDSDQARAVKIVARAHQTLIWERTRAFQRLRNTLREYFPGALNAYAGLELTSTDALELLVKAPTPEQATKLTKPQIIAVLARHRRRNREQRAAAIQAGLREPQLGVAAPVAAAYAAAATAHAKLLIALNEQIAALEEQVSAHFLAHPDAEIYLSMPGIGEITDARVPAEFGDDPTRYTSAKARKNYAGTSPITRASGRTHAVYARHARNDRLADALHKQAFFRHQRLARRPPLLRQTARTRRRLQPRPAPARQPPRRHPPRTPQDPHPLRRGHRVVTPRNHRRSRLTSLHHGMSDLRVHCSSWSCPQARAEIPGNGYGLRR